MRRTVALCICVAVTWLTPISSASAAGSPQPVVTLISAGAAPRSTLRLALTEGAVSQATMQLSETIEQTVDGSPTKSVRPPAFRIGMQTTVGHPSSHGSAPISSSYGSITVVDDGSLDSAQLDQYRAAIAPLSAVTSTATLTPRNRVLDSRIAGTEGLDPAVAQTMSQVSDQLGAASAPFPREAVGIGARWRVVSSLRVSGIDARQVYELTLRARDAGRVTFDVEYTQSAPAQAAELPGVPAGAKVRLTKWRVAGSGTTTLDLTKPVLPVTSHLHAAGAQVFEVRVAGGHGNIVQKIAIDVGVSP